MRKEVKDMKVAIATDHNGTNIKKEIIRFLNNRNIETIDLSKHNSAIDDYPLYAFDVAKKVVDKEADFGILLCGTGIGMSIAANKVKGVRASLCTDLVMAEYTRLHNDSNVLCMGARIIAYEMAEMIADKYLSTKFEGGRHQKRVDMIEE